MCQNAGIFLLTLSIREPSCLNISPAGKHRSSIYQVAERICVAGIFLDDLFPKPAYARQERLPLAVVSRQCAGIAQS
jgi:hypothetical protein